MLSYAVKLGRGVVWADFEQVTQCGFKRTEAKKQRKIKMKKLAFFAAAAAMCGGLLAVESANVVG